MFRRSRYPRGIPRSIPASDSASAACGNRQRWAFHGSWVVLAALLLTVSIAPAQERRSRIDVQHYTIDAEINQNTQTIAAKAAVRFVPEDDNATAATFELNNALNLKSVADDQGRQVPASRGQDFTVRVNFNQPLQKGTPVTLVFTYDGRLSGNEESPVYGIKFAAINNDYAFLLYPARWFPVSGYTSDRYSMDLNVTVATGNRVLASGMETPAKEEGGKIHLFVPVRARFVPRIPRRCQGRARPCYRGGCYHDPLFPGRRA